MHQSGFHLKRLCDAIYFFFTNRRSFYKIWNLMRNLKLLSFCLALFLLRASCANGRIVIFGDSLSDNGNSYAASNGRVPPSPYGTTYNSSGVPGEIFPGRFTDGKNWVDYIPGVAKAFGLNIPAVTAYLQDPQNDLLLPQMFCLKSSYCDLPFCIESVSKW